MKKTFNRVRKTLIILKENIRGYDKFSTYFRITDKNEK